jgi:hypothetical protein
MLRAVADDDNGLLNRAACHLGRAVDQQARVELAGARYAEEAGGGMRSGRGPAERKVRVVLYRTAESGQPGTHSWGCSRRYSGFQHIRMRTITQGHEGQQRPLVLLGRVLALVEPDPRFDFRAPRMVEVDDADKRRQRRGRHIVRIHSR